MTEDSESNDTNDITYSSVVHIFLGLLASMVGVLLYQVFINTPRITALETDNIAHEKIDAERIVSLDRRIGSLELSQMRLHDKLDQRIDLMNTRIDHIASQCDELRKAHGVK
jgi:hypothetical protein